MDSQRRDAPELNITRAPDIMKVNTNTSINHSRDLIPYNVIRFDSLASDKNARVWEEVIN